MGNSHSKQDERFGPVNMDLESTHLSPNMHCPVTIFDFDLRRLFKYSRLCNSGVPIAFFFINVVSRFPFNLLDLSG